MPAATFQVFVASLTLATFLCGLRPAIARAEPWIVVSPGMTLSGDIGPAGPVPLRPGIVLEGSLAWVEAMRIPAGSIAFANKETLTLHRDFLLPRAMIDVPVQEVAPGARTYCHILFGKYNVQFRYLADAIPVSARTGKREAFALCAVADCGGDTFSRLVSFDLKGGVIGHADLASPQPLRAEPGVAQPDGSRVNVEYRHGKFRLNISNSVYQDGSWTLFDTLEGWQNGRIFRQPQTTRFRRPADGQTEYVSILGARFAIQRVGPGKDDLLISVLKGFDQTLICAFACEDFYRPWRALIPSP